ncbi:MAG TPA: cysteine desulfurase family protein [Alphaproteobacteria bacterium]|nr:cysteine desulfurase family protein [Alphaproteobacteria bacterium]
MGRSVYLDYNATQPIRPEARDAMLAALAEPSNASSIHRHGQEARRLVEDARVEVAALIGAAPGDIIFTSGATEANATALNGLGADRLLVSAVEHPSVAKAAKCIETVAVDRHGVLDLEALDRQLGAGGRALVSLMLVNNETGIIQPVAEAARITHAHGALLHSDAVQAGGRIPVDVDRLGVDLLTLSGHKIGGPQGVGALYVRSGLELTPLLRGGGQEGRRRAGTENVAAIAGFGAAARATLADLGRMSDLAALRDGMEAKLRAIAPDLVIHGMERPRIANTSCFGASGLPAETALIALDLAGISVSSGAACSSGAVEPSSVLLAMGLAETAAREAIRVSFGWATEAEDLDRLVESWSLVYRRTRAVAATAA